MWRTRTRTILLSLLATCGLWTASSGPAVAQTVMASQYGFSFSLPPKWTEIPLSSKDVGTLISAATQADPALENALSQQVTDAAKEGLKVFAVGPVSGDFIPNMNIMTKADPGVPTGSAFVNDMSLGVKITLGAYGATQVEVAAVDLRLGQAVQASYVLKLKFAGRSISDRGIQLYFQHFGRLYVVTFSSLSLTQDQATAQVVEGSWQWRALAA